VAAGQCRPKAVRQLPGDVVVFYDRNDHPNPHRGKQPGDEGAQKLAGTERSRGQVGLVPMPDNCEVKGWDISNALDRDLSGQILSRQQ